MARAQASAGGWGRTVLDLSGRENADLKEGAGFVEVAVGDGAITRSRGAHFSAAGAQGGKGPGAGVEDGAVGFVGGFAEEEDVGAVDVVEDEVCVEADFAGGDDGLGLP